MLVRRACVGGAYRSSQVQLTEAELDALFAQCNPEAAGGTETLSYAQLAAAMIPASYPPCATEGGAQSMAQQLARPPVPRVRSDHVRPASFPRAR